MLETKEAKPQLISPALDSKPLKAQMPMREWLRFFLPYLRPYWKRLATSVLLMAAGAAFSVFRPWPLKIVIDLVITHKRHCRVPLIGPWLDQAPLSRMEILYWACAAGVLISLLSGVLTYSCTRLLGDTAQRFIFALRKDLFAHMQRLSLRFHDTQRTGDLTTRLTSDVQGIQDLIMTGLVLIGTNGLQLVGMLALMIWLDWRFTLAALAVVPFLFLMVTRYTRRIKFSTRQARKSTGMMAALAQEALSSIRIVQGLAQENQIDERFEAKSEGYLHAYLETVRYQARVGPIADLISSIGLSLVIWYGATRAISGSLTTGDVVIFFTYVTSFYRPLRALGRSSYLFNRASVGAERIIEVMHTQSELKDRKTARPAPQLTGKIEFEDVSFDYDPGRKVLAHINLSIEPGEKIAIVGSTGAGKSTLVSLVPRFYDPTEGVVRIDGEDIRNYTLNSLREQISLVLQDSLLFSGTIRENIAFGCPDATLEDIIAAAQTANADEFIQRLPEGYDTPIAERATTLSGGQKQRIAIARAVLRGAPILILDEPTTGLDAHAERIVLDALERATAGRTSLIIAHRLTTVRLADRILVLEHGRIAEEGTHAELVAMNGLYAQLYHLQAAIHPDDEYVPAAPVASRKNRFKEGRVG